MTVTGFSHLALGVADLDKSLEFYCGLLGLRLHTRYRYQDFARAGDEGNDNPEWDGAEQTRSFALVHVAPPAGGNTAFLSITDRARGDYVRPEMWNWGVHHFGVWVEDFDAVVARLRAAGTPIAVDISASDSYNWAMDAGQTIRTIVVRDPDGNMVQLDESAG
jgi:glyoxylase I family protein